MKKAIIGLIALAILIQLAPYGKDHKNPGVIAEPEWAAPQTRTLFMRACGDCHSHETRWPWYSNIAPVSWMVYRHVAEGREHFNVSRWGHQRKNDGNEAAEEIREGEMPPASYLLAHPEARLSESEKITLIEGLKRTFGDKEKDDD